MRRSGRAAVVAAAGPPALAAVLGNAFVGKPAMRWFTGLRQPALQVPLPAFVVVGGVYYVQLGYVLHRAQVRADGALRTRALLVLAGNELWNLGFFRQRSTRNGFVGLLLFLGPLLALQAAAASDRRASVALLPYTAWVLAYDVPWTFQLWRLNP